MLEARVDRIRSCCTAGLICDANARIDFIASVANARINFSASDANRIDFSLPLSMLASTLLLRLTMLASTLSFPLPMLASTLVALQT